MTEVPRRQLYWTALSILFVVMILLVFISVSTYRNFNRDRDATLQAVHRQALTLINALEAGARAGMMTQKAGQDVIGHLVHEIGRSGDVNYLYLANAAGDVVYHSIPSLEGTRALWRPRFDLADEVRTRTRTLPDGTPVFEVAKPFPPLPAPAHPTAAPSTPPANARATVYLAMNLTAYAAARQADLHHAMIMGAIVLALGGGVIYFFIVLRSYYRLSKTLQETRDYTRQIIASMVHGVLSIDATGIVMSCNRQARTLLGIPAAERDRIDLRTIFDFTATGIARTLTQGAPVLGQEVEISRKAAAPLPLLLTVTPIQDEAGDRSGAVVVLRDLSEIKRLEEKVRRAEKLAAIGRLAAGVAHEIRNPLSSIRGFAYWLGKDQGEHATRREYADVMVREIDRINRVVTDLLNFARPMALEPKAIRVIDLIDHVVSLVSAEAKRQSIDIQVAVTEDLPPLFIDPHQVTQALLNLLLNAMGGLEAGGAIHLRASVEDERQTAVFHVEDNGPGIDPAIQAKIFEPFFTTRERGTGLGLAMVRKIAENHDGEILLESPPPGKAHGACFTLRLRSTPACRIAGSEEEKPDPDDPALIGERP